MIDWASWGIQILEQKTHEMDYNSFKVQRCQRSKFDELINEFSNFGAIGSLERVSTFTSFLKFPCSLCAQECRAPNAEYLVVYHTGVQRIVFDMSY